MLLSVTVLVQNLLFPLLHLAFIAAFLHAAKTRRFDEKHYPF